MNAYTLPHRTQVTSAFEHTFRSNVHVHDADDQIDNRETYFTMSQQEQDNKMDIIYQQVFLQLGRNH